MRRLAKASLAVIVIAVAGGANAEEPHKAWWKYLKGEWTFEIEALDANTAEILTQIREMLEKYLPKPWDGLLQLGKEAMEQGNFAEAITPLRQAWDESGRELEITLAYAQALIDGFGWSMALVLLADPAARAVSRSISSTGSTSSSPSRSMSPASASASRRA